MEMITRFNKQIITIINLLCKSDERDLNTPGLNPQVIEKAVWSCFQETPVEFMNYSLYDSGAYPELPICYKIVWRVTSPPGKLAGQSEKPKVAALTLYKLLPKTNCKQCGLSSCFTFAISLNQGKKNPEDCPPLSQPEFEGDRQALTKLLE